MREKSKKFSILIGLFFLSLSLTADELKQEEVFNIFHRLSQEMKMDKDKKSDLKNSLEKALISKYYQTKKENKAVTGVFLYYSREGGFIVKGISGEGVAVFSKQDKMKKFELRGISGGATIGGSAVWTVGLILGDCTSQAFEGKYGGATSNATAVKASAHNAYVMTPKGAKDKDEKHILFLVYSGTGFSAGAGGTSITIKYTHSQ